MPFISEEFRQAIAPKAASNNYLKIKKNKEGDKIRFLILSPEPIHYWCAWGKDKETGKSKPFRFVKEPKSSEIDAEMGPNFERGTKYGSDEPRPAAACTTFFCWDYDSESVCCLEIDKTKLNQELDAISQQEEYKNIHDWDLVITYKGPNNGWYSMMALPRKPGYKEMIEEAWAKAQSERYDLKQLLVGGSPFGQG